MSRISILTAILEEDATRSARIAALTAKLIELEGGPTGIQDTGLGVSEDAANGATAGTFLIEGGTAPYTITITSNPDGIWRIANSGVSADGVVEVEVDDNTNLPDKTTSQITVKITDTNGLIYDDVLVEIPVTAVIPSDPAPITGISLSANSVAFDAANDTFIGNVSMVGGVGDMSACSITVNVDGIFALAAPAGTPPVGALTVGDNTNLPAKAGTQVNATFQISDSASPTPQTASFQATIHVTGTPAEPPPGDTPDVVDTVQYTSTVAKTDHTIPAVPTGTGGLLSLLVATDKGRSITVAGWTEVYNILVEDGSEGTSYSCRAARFVKVDAGETTVDFVIGTGDGHCSAILSRLTDVDHADIVNAISGTPLRTTGVTEAACPSVTTDEADTLVFCDCITGHKRAITLPAGLTALANIENGGGVSLASVTKQKATAGATTAETFSWAGGAPVIALQTAINFGVGGGTPPPDPEPDPGTTVEAASGSAADIQAAHDAASPGDTVLIPNSTGQAGGAWAFGNNNVTITKRLTIKGNGRDVCAIQRLHAAPSRMFDVLADSVKFTGFELRGTAWDNGGADLGIVYRGGRLNQNVDLMRFTKLAYGGQSLVHNNAPAQNPTGCISRNEFIQLGSANNNGKGYGWEVVGLPGAWGDAATNGLGLDDLVGSCIFFEDNLAVETRHPISSTNGARYVARNNTAIDCSRKSASVGSYDVHGRTLKAWDRGGIVTLLKNNTVDGVYAATGGDMFSGFQARGGFVVCYGHDVTNTVRAVISLQKDDDDFLGDPYDGFFWNNKRNGVVQTDVFDGAGGGDVGYRNFGYVIGTDAHISAGANPPAALATFLQSGVHGVTTWAEIQAQLDAVHPLRA